MQLIEELESRVKQLEHLPHHEAAKQSQSGSAASSNPDPPGLVINGHEHSGSRLPSMSPQEQQGLSLPSISQNGMLRASNPSASRDTRRVPVSLAIDLHLSQRKNLFGSASGIGSFISEVVQHLHANPQTFENVQPIQVSATMNTCQRTLPATDQSSFQKTLPPKQTADLLISTYWTHYHTIFPFLDRIEIESLYEQIWQSDQIIEEDSTFPVILNVMFALSVRLISLPSTEDRDSAGKQFISAGYESTTCDVWNHTTFRAVQALLLLGLYNHTTDPHQAWKAIGQAVNISQNIGLHLPETSEGLSTLRERELARKVWHGCIMMDRILSQTYGRHPMLSKAVAGAVPLPLSISEADLDTRLNHVEEVRTTTPNMTEFYVQSLKLYEIFADTLAQFYTNQPDSFKSLSAEYEHYVADPDGKSILFYENQLQNWFDNLPDYLRWSHGSVDHSIFTRQAAILRQRLLQKRTLLLRTALRSIVANRNLPDDSENKLGMGGLQFQIMLQCAVACVRTAQEAIETILSHGPPDPSAINVVSAWVHNILFLYTPATILMAARLCQPISAIIGETSIARSWDDALRLLRMYGPYGPPARHALGVLLKVDDQIRRKNGAPGAAANTTADMMIPTSNIPKADSSTVDGTTGVLSPFGMTQQPSAVQLDQFDLSILDVEDLSWMDSIPFNI